MPNQYGAYLRWTLRVLSVGVAGVVGVLLLPSLLESSGVRDTSEGDDLPNPPNDGVPVSVPAADNLYFSSFDGVHIFENRGSKFGTVARKPYALERRMFNQLQEEVVRYLNGRGQQHFSHEDCNDIRYRLLPTTGLQADVICSASSSGSERVVLELPFHSGRILLHTHVDATQTLAIIVTLQGRIDALQRLLSNLQEVAQGGGLLIALTIVYFADHYTEEAAAALQASRDIAGLQTQFIILEGEFSRSKGLKVGVERDESGAEVVFLCDVDIFIKRDFLFRCLAYPSQGDKVFFPVFFSQHNPSLTYRARGRKVPHTPFVKLADNHGYWRLWSYGMVCMYKSDFLKINGFDSHMTGWGGEDLLFAKQVTARGYTITRSLDHGLFHYYHPKDCSHARKKERFSCLRVQATCEASGQTFGLLYFKKKYSASIWSHIKSKETQEGDVEVQVDREEDETINERR